MFQRVFIMRMQNDRQTERQVEGEVQRRTQRIESESPKYVIRHKYGIRHTHKNDDGKLYQFLFTQKR